jgi:hypothetical protein
LAEIQEYVDGVSKLKAKLKTRDSLLMDYDNYRIQWINQKEKDQKEKNYAQKLAQAEEKYLACKTKYENFNVELIKELKTVLNQRYETIDSHFQKVKDIIYNMLIEL